MGQKLCPKMSTCALLAKLNKLNTKERISRWNSSTGRICMLCLNHQEDRDHLLIQCNYSRYLLDYIKSKLNINTSGSYDINRVLDTMSHN